MSGVTSTISDTGRVYLFDRNALPKNFIEYGMRLTTDGLAAIVGTGSCDIGGKYHELSGQASISIPQRVTCLLYAAKSDLADTPTLGYVQAAFPAADSGTVCRWIIDGSATIASTVGTNDLTRNGTVTQVDGWIGYGGKGDGSTGYYVSANSTGFPAGAAARTLDMLVTINRVNAIEILAGYGAASTGYEWSITNESGGLKIYLSNTICVTGYTLEIGKTYYICAGFDGTDVLVYINGALIYKAAVTVNTQASVLNVLRRFVQPSGSYATASVHYVELRNALRPPAQIAAISNALLLPCRYYTSETENTYTDVRAVLPADTISLGRIRTSSTAITEARMEYQDGRREGAWGGNRRMFLGWKACSGNQQIGPWPWPFDTRKASLRVVYAEDAAGRNETPCIMADAYSTSYPGVWFMSTPTNPVYVIAGAGGAAMISGNYKTSGYIGIYAEVME